MRNGLNRLSALCFIGAVGFNVQDHVLQGVEIKHPWNTVLWIVAAVSAVAFVLTLEPVWTALLNYQRRPIFESVGVTDYWRTARDSPRRADLQVAYTRIRNARDGGGDRSTARGVRAWMEAFNMTGEPLSRARGVLMNIDARVPDPSQNTNMVDLPPTRHEVGLEIAGKFLFAEDAYLAGEADPPSLKPGKYRIRASIGNGVHRAQTFEWHVENFGKDRPLAVSGITHPLHILETTRADYEQMHRNALVITSARYGVLPDLTADVKDRLTELIDGDGVLDFVADFAHLMVDPAPGQFKELHVRWLDHGIPDASAYHEGTHIVIPRSAARQQ